MQIDGGHDEAKRYELQHYAPAHQVLAEIGAAAPQHVPQARKKHHRNPGKCDRNDVGRQGVHGSSVSLPAAHGTITFVLPGRSTLTHTLVPPGHGVETANGKDPAE